MPYLLEIVMVFESVVLKGRSDWVDTTSFADRFSCDYDDALLRVEMYLLSSFA